MVWNYAELKQLSVDVELPAMFVDLDELERNASHLAQIASAHGKRIRVASKSVRVPRLLHIISDSLGEVFGGLMCFAAAEARLLDAEGFDDLLIAYPVVQEADLTDVWEMTWAGTSITVMVDSQDHLDRLDAFCEEQSGGAGHPPIRICLDVDMAWRPVGVHVGAQRSSIRDLETLGLVVDRIRRSRHLELDGIMGYEAQIAGVGERNPFAPLLNPVKQLMKQRSVADVARRRGAIARWLDREKMQVRFFNGGGTGSISSTCREPWITEVAAGSGFLQPHLFDYYPDQHRRPAFCFGLRVTRNPQPSMITCQGGGFIASGETGPDKQPTVFQPEGVRPTRTEGYGEVQTPLQLPDKLLLEPGDPVFFRPAKAGEIAERFDEYLLCRQGEIVERAKTYRGLGHCFH